MKLFQRLNQPPSKTLRRVLVALLLLAILLDGIGSYVLLRSLTSGRVPNSFAGEFTTNAEGTVLPNEISSSTQPLNEGSAPVVALTPWDGTGRVTVLIMGLDYRDWSAGEGPSRTDSMMLLTLDPLDNTAGMLSIPRDLWVSIPGFENGRINTAYFLGEAYQLPGGGPGLAVKTVEQLLGVTINYYAQIDFNAFIRFVDEIGGVKVDVPEKIKIDPIVGDPIKLKPGIQVLDGELTLAYARARYTQGGDFDRAKRQQQVIFGIRDRLLSSEALSTLIAKAPTLYAELASGIQTNLTLEEVIKLALLAQKVPAENIRHGVISTQQVLFAESPDGQAILVPLPEKIRQLRDEVFLASTGTLGPLTPGTAEERMAQEQARLVLLNGSTTEGLATNTQAYLQAQGANVVQTGNGELAETTRIIDYTGNPHTVQYLAKLFKVPEGNVTLQYDPASPVDVTVTLGIDWGSSNPLP